MHHEARVLTIVYCDRDCGLRGRFLATCALTEGVISVLEEPLKQYEVFQVAALLLDASRFLNTVRLFLPKPSHFLPIFSLPWIPSHRLIIPTNATDKTENRLNG